MPALGTEAFDAARRSFNVRSVIRQLRDEELDTQSSRGRQLQPSDVPLEDCLDAFRLLVSQGYAVEPANTHLSAQQRRPIGMADLADHPPASPAGGEIAPEVELQLDDPALRVKIDLVIYGDNGDTLIDFKSGIPKDHHRLQSDIYGAVWVTVTGRTVGRRQILYSENSVVELKGMDQAAAAQALDSVRRRIDQCLHDLRTAPPVARPQVDICRHCAVRQLCTAYWNSPETAELRIDSTTPFGEWKDLDLNISHALWDDDGFSITPGPNQTTALYCRVPSRYRPQQPRFSSVRLLGVAVRPVGPAAEVVWSAASEAFWLR